VPCVRIVARVVDTMVCTVVFYRDSVADQQWIWLA
jgi:hypothetical protein